jgi:integrase
VVTTLAAHRERQAQERLAAADYWLDQDLVFATEIGTPLEPRSVLR